MVAVTYRLTKLITHRAQAGAHVHHHRRRGQRNLEAKTQESTLEWVTGLARTAYLATVNQDGPKAGNRRPTRQPGALSAV